MVKRQIPQDRQLLIASVKLGEFYGGTTVTACAYRQRKKHVNVTKALYGLTDQESALVIFSQVKGKAK